MNRTLAIAAIVAGIIAGVICATQFPAAENTRTVPNIEAASSPAIGKQSGDSPASAFETNHPILQKLFSALRDPLELRRNATIYEAIQALKAEDFDLAMAAFARLPLEFHYPLIESLIERWVRVDPEAASRWIREHPRFMGWAGAAWAKSDPEGATRAALSRVLDRNSESLLGAIAQHLSAGQIGAHWATLKNMPAGPPRERALRNALNAFAYIDPAAAFVMAGDLSDRKLRTDRKLEILEQLAARDPHETLSKLAGMLPEIGITTIGNASFNQVVAAVAAKDVAAAIEWITALPDEMRMGPAIAAARLWVAKEPAAALDWCLENGVEITRVDRRGFNGWQSGVLAHSIAERTAETLAWLEALSPGPQRDQFMEAALDGSLSFGSKGGRFDGDNPPVMQLFVQLPPAAQERQAEALAKARIEYGAIPDLGAWATQFADGPIRQKAIKGALARAFENDASQVDSMLATLKSAPERDAALGGLANAIKESEPTAAASRALEISDLSLRQKALENVIVFWLKQDPAQCKEWLEQENASVPEGWKQAWLRSATKGG